MGLFDFFKKANVKITTSEVQFNDEPRYIIKHKSKNGLYFYETLMLSYAEKYFSGKPIARFWQYDYGIENVPKILKSLEKRGFIENGKLTQLGISEIEENEYILYLHRHKNWGLDFDNILNKIDDYPKKEFWRDIIWGEFNRQYSEFGASLNIGLMRNTKFNMYQFVIEEKNYSAAFSCLAEVFFMDLNGRPCNGKDIFDLIPSGIKYDFKPIVKELQMSDQQMYKQLEKYFTNLLCVYKNFSAQEAATIITAITFDSEEIAEKIFKEKIRKR